MTDENIRFGASNEAYQWRQGITCLIKLSVPLVNVGSESAAASLEASTSAGWFRFSLIRVDMVDEIPPPGFVDLMEITTQAV